MRRILYIGDFTAPHSTENYVTYGLQQNGCTVYKLSLSNIPNANAVLGAALSYQVDLVLFSKGSFKEAAQAIQLLRKHQVRTIGWVFDLFFDLPKEFGRRSMNAPSFMTDLCFVTDGGHEGMWRDHGVRTQLLRQGIHEPEAYRGTPSEHPAIAFIGTASYGERTRLIDFLRLTYGEDFVHYGLGGDRREVRGAALNDVLASCKIIVGDSVPSPNYWSNRIYEITGRGGFLLHPKTPGLEQEFTDGVHYVSFERDKLPALRDTIDHYLTNEAERRLIQQSGYNATRHNYTYTKRCATLLEYACADER